MPWSHDQLTAVDTLLFKSKRVKVGRFACRADHPCFPISESLDNDVFVMPKRSVWVQRDDSEYHFVEPGAILMHRAGQTGSHLRLLQYRWARRYLVCLILINIKICDFF